MNPERLKRIKDVAGQADNLEREIGHLKLALDEIQATTTLTISFGEGIFASARLPHDPERHLKRISACQVVRDLHEEFRGMLLELIVKRLNDRTQQLKELDV